MKYVLLVFFSIWSQFRFNAVLGEFDGKEAAFLLQNMFPIRDYYLDHIHRGKKVVFPDIDRLEQIMLAEVKDNAAE